MLVLTRKVGQSVMIGSSIEVTLIEVRGEQVRLGISAPVEVPVRRKELLDRESASDSVAESPSAQSVEPEEDSEAT